MKYLVVIEPTQTGFSAYSPDLPGCVATGADRAALERTMAKAIAFHLDGLTQGGLPVPEARASSMAIEVPENTSPTPDETLALAHSSLADVPPAEVGKVLRRLKDDDR